MAILTVGPTSSFPTIAAAVAAAGTGDIISLEAGYGNENATVTVDGLSFDGGPSSTNINLQLASGISSLTLLGTAPINVLDATDGNNIVGNGGDNVVTVTGGADAVSGGLGTDRLVVDYRLTSGAVTGNSTTNFADAGGLGIVTINGGFEHFTILTGSGADTITTGAGDDIINTGEGASTVVAGAGANSITGGSGADTITALDGGNFIDGGNGDNTITSGAGNDVITGGIGVDTIVAGGGADVITVRGGADSSDSGAGNDRLVVDYSSSTTAVNGGVTGGTLAAGYDGTFADVAGTSSVVFQGTENFTVTTGSGNDVIATGDGNDVLDGGMGSDQLNGGGGADTLLIGLGNDALDGGADTDTVMFSAARTNYQVTDLGGGVIQTIDLRSGSPDGTDTLVNMEGFVFTDGTFNATTVLNDPPTLGGDLAITVANGGSVVVTAADLTATDADSTNAQLVYTVTGALHGTVLLAGIATASFTQADILANAVSFQHDGSATNGSFTVSLTDGTATPQVVTVTAAEVNAPPSATNDALSAVAEDSGQRTILGSTLTGNDSAGPASESGQTLTVTAVSNVIGGSASVSGGNVLFTPTANFSGAASFDYTVTDDGTTNGVADPRTATATASFTVNAMNDTPVNTVPASIGVTEDTPSVLMGIVVSDVDAGAGIVTATLSVPSGSLAAATGGGVTVGGSSSSMMLSGTIADINAFIAGSNVTFTTATNATADVTLTVTLTDGGNTGTDPGLTGNGTSEEDTDLVTLTVTAVNDAPEGTDNTVITPESTPYTLTTADFGFTDPNDTLANDLLAVTITTLPMAGTLTLSGGAVSAGQSIPVASITAGDLVFTPAPGINGSAYATFTFQVQDNGGAPGVDLDPSANIITIDVTASDVNHPPIDSNGDTKSDLLLVNNTTHDVSIWQMNGTQVVASPVIGTINAAAGWQFTTIADFNGDDKSDLLLLNDTTHGVAVWQLNGTQVEANPQVGTINAAAGWRYADIGDFNGDNKTDLLFLNDTTNGVAIWQMNGTQVELNPQVGTINVAEGWHYTATADFNGDGKSDLLLQSDTIHGLAIWQMNGTQVEENPRIGMINAADGWRYADIGDFNGDGKADLLFLNDTTHGVAVWQMNGTQVEASAQVGTINAAAGWHYEAVADFNGDGKSDLLLLNDTTNGVAVWQMNGTQVEANPQVGTINAAAGWHYADLGDFNGDDKTDLLLLNDTTNGVAIWQMNGTQVETNPQVGMVNAADGWHLIV